MTVQARTRTDFGAWLPEGASRQRWLTYHRNPRLWTHPDRAVLGVDWAESDGVRAGWRTIASIADEDTPLGVLRGQSEGTVALQLTRST